jgi:two-component system OmpR family sensor kinase/two-component system sensor histidine kinase BaeS
LPPPFFRSAHPPPWWPPDEPWPPNAERWQHWRRSRRRYFWRVGVLMLILFTFLFFGCSAVVGTAAAFLGMIGTAGGPPWPGPGGWVALRGPWPFLLFSAFTIVVLGATVAVRALVRTTAPVGDLMEAIGRVESGDYATRIHERGPREVRDLARAFNAMAGRLQRSEQQRRDLLADVTHELRTPLTVMQGNLEALMDEVYPRDDAHLAPILDETRVLARLVEDLRTLALAESGALKLHPEPTDLAILIDETASSFRAQADSAGVTLAVTQVEDLPLLEIDPVRIREVLANLVANALRHTPAGGTIEIGASPAAGGEAAVTVYVRDTGTGISPDDLPHIFDRFYRSEQSRGMGLGLAIARNLVTAHRGTIAAESQPGGGTIIRFTLPA